MKERRLREARKGKREKGLKRRNEISNEVVPIVGKSLSDAF